MLKSLHSTKILSALDFFAVETCCSRYSHFLTMPSVGFDFIHSLFRLSPVQISISESCVYSHGRSLSAAGSSGSSRLITACAFRSSSSRYPSITNPSVVKIKKSGSSFRDCDCSIDFAMTLVFISCASSRKASSMFRPSLFFVRSDNLKIFVFVALFRMKR